MSASTPIWKKGRGKLGLLAPLLGTWQAEADSPQGPVLCTRTFTHILDGAYIQLTAHWQIARGTYDELALIGVGDDGRPAFWSFTSDGKRAHGMLTDASDVHPEAIGFEAEMPAGRARMIYWPDATDGFHWAVEAWGKQGWRRFTEHHYHGRL